MNDNPETLAIVSYHYSDGYQTDWGGARADFNDIPGYPSLIYDGVLEGWPINTYVSKFHGQQVIDARVTIDLEAQRQTFDVFDITATLCVESGLMPKNMRIYMVQVLDNWPDDPGYPDHVSRNCFMQAASTEDVTVNVGACTEIVRSLKMSPTSLAHEQDIRVIVWAQTQADNGPAEVYQAAQIDWNEMISVVFGDDFESGEPDGWSEVVE